MTTERTELCMNCKFRAMHTYNNHYGELTMSNKEFQCRRRAPVSQLASSHYDSTKTISITRFPVVQAHFWCGEWEAEGV